MGAPGSAGSAHVEAGAGEHEGVAAVGVTMLARDHEWCLAVDVGRIDGRARTDERGNRHLMPAKARVVKRAAPPSIGSVHPCTRTEKD